jgi:hypothetical protein
LRGVECVVDESIVCYDTTVFLFVVLLAEHMFGIRAGLHYGLEIHVYT